jgi:hypothetical protein
MFSANNKLSKVKLNLYTKKYIHIYDLKDKSNDLIWYYKYFINFIKIHIF